MKAISYFSKVFYIFLILCSMAVHGQINLAVSAVASADTFVVDHPPVAVIDGVKVDGKGWAAQAMDTSTQNQVNIAPTATVTASAFHEGNGGYYPEEAIDGIIGAWQAWAASAGGNDLDQWLELTWPSAQTVYKVVLHTNPLNDGGYALRGYRVQYWDGSGYQDLDTVSGNKAATVTSNFDAVTTRKIRILCTETDSLSSFYRISELEVYSSVKMDPHWLDLSWTSAQILSKLVLFTSSDPDHALRGFEVHYWDGHGFKSATAVSGNTDSRVTCRFHSVTTTRVRINCTEPGLSDNWYRINEVEIYDDPLPSVDDSTWNMDFETINHFFPSPPNQYRTAQYTLNQDLQQGNVDRLLDYGFGGIQTMSPSSNYQYLQDENGWAQMAGDVELALENDMKVWIHDELGYPSGAAGGLVVEDHPEYENRGIFRITQKGQGAVGITMELPADKEFFRATLALIVNGEPDYENATQLTITDHQINATGLAGDWQVSVFGIKILDENTQAQSTVEQFGQTGHFPSLLNREACARFVEFTHQNYADHLGDMHRKVELYYTNEPNLMTTHWQYDGSAGEDAYLAWEDDLPNQFMAIHGYDLIPRLDALFEGFSTQSKMARLHFHQTVGEVMANNFSGQITQWCHENGVLSSGHLLLEEYMICHAIYYGDFMKVIRKQDVPACDLPIARPEKTDWYFWMPKFISSASYLEDKNAMVVGLIDPIIGFGRDDMSPEIPYLKRTFNMAFLCGLNQFNSYIPYLEYVGEEKEQHIQLTDYMARISLMLKGAKNEASIGMYYPIETFQSNYKASSLTFSKIVQSYSYLQRTLDRMAADILQNGLDYNYLTADAILDASIVEGKVMVGTQLYSSIVMPRVEVIPLDVLKKLQSFTDAGIPVHWVDALPSLGTKQGDHDEVKQIASALEISIDPLPDLRLTRDRELSIQISSSDDKLFMSRYSRNGHYIYYVINDSKNEITLTTESEMTDSVQLYNPVNGEIRKVSLPLSEAIGGYESLILVEAISAIDNGPVSVDAGPDTIICESDFQEYRPGNFVSIEGGSPPYSYTWSCDSAIQGDSCYASAFLNDTSTAHPHFINAFDTLGLTLEVVDALGNIAYDNLLVVVSRFEYCTSGCTESIYKGDSVQLRHCISGGTLPYTFNWDNEETLSNPSVSDPWAKPESDTEYILTLTDARACITVSSCAISVLPTGIGKNDRLNYEISLYPNPARASVQLEVPAPLIGSILEIRDISGRTFYTQKIVDELSTINVSLLKPGLYFVGMAGKATFRKLILE